MSPITEWRSGAFQTARDLLMRAHPRIGARPIQQDGESVSMPASGRARDRQRSLPHSGPAGFRQDDYRRPYDLRPGKCRKTVGVTANSHKVIRNLLDKVAKTAVEMGVHVREAFEAVADGTDLPQLRFVKNTLICSFLSAMDPMSQEPPRGYGRRPMRRRLLMCCSSMRRRRWRRRACGITRRNQSCCSGIRSS